MTISGITTPFGGGRMTARSFLTQKAVAEAQARLVAGDGGNDSGRADKWRLLQALTEARFSYGLGDRTIAVLEALLGFSPGRELDGAAPLVVFPSNRALSARARGMAPSTIRRHLSELVRQGFLIRRDSPNGKRYCRRTETGEAGEVFGFDLAPLALRSAEIFEAAETARAQERLERALRTEISLQQRDISKILDAALEEGRAGPFEDLALRHRAFSPRLRRREDRALLQERLEALVILRADVENAYLSSLSDEEMSASDHHDERHIQSSNTDLIFELNGYDPNTGEAAGGGAGGERDGRQDGDGGRTGRGGGEAKAPGKEGAEGQDTPRLETKSMKRPAPVDLARLLKACPAILDYASSGIRSLQDLMRTADLVRSVLGISPDAWRQAQLRFGPEQAAAVIALMLEGAERIRSPGGYLRSLTRKAETGGFSLLPMLQAVERSRS